MVIKMRIAQFKFWLCKTALVSALGIHSSSVYSAPGELSDIPLFLGNQVTPNVLFLLDDSGSMANEVLVRSSALAVYPGGGIKDNRPAWRGNLDMTPSYGNRLEMLESCLGFNVTAFDPNRTEYPPWIGYSNMDVSVAAPLADSYPMGVNYENDASTTYSRGVDGDDNEGGDIAGGGARLDLMGTDTTGDEDGAYVGYMPWIDADGDGEFDAEECNETAAAAATNIGELEAAGFVRFEAMSDAQKQNFANWYSYYRKRRFLLMGPMLDILQNTDIRAGLATINNNINVGVPITDLTDPTPLERADSLEDQTNREYILERMLRVGLSPQGTPLRRPLELAGRYYNLQAVDAGFLGNSSSEVVNDPILPSDEGGRCQHNYTMLMTDGLSTENAFTRPDFSGRPGTANADADSASSPYDGGRYADTSSNTMGDIAMHYYETDLRDYPNNVESNKFPNGDSNEERINPAQHMETYTIAFGVTGNLSDFDPEGTESSVTWPAATSDLFWGDAWGGGATRETIDDLMHAAYNGRGEFLSAVNPEELSESLNRIVADIIASNEGSAASVGFNSTNISEGTRLYQSRFFADNWRGTLRAFEFESGVQGSQLFDSGDLLAFRVANEGHTSRQIITYNGNEGIPFHFPADHTNLGDDELSQAQVDDLLLNADGVDDQAFGENIVAFLRGDSSVAQDGDVFRDRGEVFNGNDSYDPRAWYVLGDIAHSSPQVVSVPDESYPDSIEEGDDNEYSTFVASNESRIPMVYVGANDGMLHAFYAESDGSTIPTYAAGDEAFAYIPSILFSTEDEQGLHYLADVDYTHIPYVDATPTPGDVFIGDAWRTYLVGGLGRGGRGIYVLDITNPNNFSEANADDIVVKEFTHNDLGYTFSRPQIAKLNDGRWAAVFGNGYAQDSGDGRAKLFILYLDSASPEYRVIDTAQGSIVNNDCLDVGSDCNGLSSPALVDITRDAVLDRVYAGDLHGNMWAFDLSSEDPSLWGVAHRTGSNVEPLFTACSETACSASNRQPITAEPVVVGHATEGARVTAPNTFVLFGTGQYLTVADIEDASQQTFYGVWDAGSTNGELDRSDLTEQTITTTPSGFRTLPDDTDVNYSTGTGGNFGWFIDLPDAGERSVITPILAGEVILFVTSIPDDAPCDAGGSGYLMAAGIFDGGRTNFDVFGEPLQMGVSLENLPVGTAFIDDTSVIPDATGTITPIDTNVGQAAQSRRFNWSIIK